MSDVPGFQPPPPPPRETPKVGDLNHYGYAMIPPDISNYAEPDPSIEVCRTCDMKHYDFRGLRSCAGHTKLGLPCRKWPSTGLEVCLKHGAQLPDARRQSRRKIAEKKAAKSLAKVKIEPLGDPIDHLSDLAAEAIAIKSHFADVVAELRQIGSPAHVGGDDLNENADLSDFLNRRDSHGYRFTDDKGAEQLDARVALYERAIDRAEKFLVNLVKLDFEERRTRLDESRVALMLDFTRALVIGLGLDINDPRVEALIRSLAPILDGLPPTPIEVQEAEAS